VSNFTPWQDKNMMNFGAVADRYHLGASALISSSQHIVFIIESESALDVRAIPVPLGSRRAVIDNRCFRIDSRIAAALILKALPAGRPMPFTFCS
jgi:hypothetical protein